MSSAAARALTFHSFVEGAGKFQWLTSSGRPCEGPMGGCAGREGVVGTLADWVGRGLPRTGWSFCGGRCYCLVLPLVDFGFGIDESLDLGGIDFDLAATRNGTRAAGGSFGDVERLDPQDFIDDLRTMPAVGAMRRKLDLIVADFEAGSITFARAMEIADDLLGLT